MDGGLLLRSFRCSLPKGDEYKNTRKCKLFHKSVCKENSMFQFLVLSVDFVNNANYLIKIKWLQPYKMVVSKSVDVLTVKDIATWNKETIPPIP